MPKVDKEITLKRDNDIREAFYELCRKNKSYSNQYIYSLLSEKFYLSASRIQSIIRFSSTDYK
jgi:hypothetical protein